MHVVAADVPPTRTNADYVRDYRNADPVRAAQNKARYRHNNSKWMTDAQYLERPFVAWDGEGITTPDGRHLYVMLAVKAADGDSDYCADTTGLSTTAIFEFILTNAARHSNGIHVIYGGGYDFNLWMRDLTRPELQRVYSQKYVTWNGYRIGWRRGKSFYLARVDFSGRTIGHGVTIYDVVSFFQCSFVKACDAYLGPRFHERDMIVTNKALRSSFVETDVPVMRKYNDAELVNLLALMHDLRERLNRCTLRPRRWDGPGAVAAALLTRERVKTAMHECPPPVAEAARFAYAGGRFEIVRFGHVETVAYEYDLNSAYPAALCNVPDLTDGHWTRHRGDPGPQAFALYHVEYHGTDPNLPGALFRRETNGAVSYPMSVTGWYWSPEVEASREYCARGYGHMRILEAWVYSPASERKPFTFVGPLYTKRLALKDAHDGAHVGIKLALNSLYGKLAQQIGWERKRDGTLKIPPFHQLEWAGYVTSWCRAKVLAACLDHLSDVIAFETDAVFTSAPLEVNVSSALGDFGLKVFQNLTYVQSGLYFADADDETVVKTRGVDRCRCADPATECVCGSLTRARVLAHLSERKAIDRVATATLTRFVGAGVALTQDWSKWCTWEVMLKHLTLEPAGKRVHSACPCMRREAIGIETGTWHLTECPLRDHTHSCAFPVEWINPNPDMIELSELRERVPDYD